MIYRLHFRAADGKASEHRLGELLLGYALFHEQRLNYEDEVIIHNEWGKPALRDYPGIHYSISHCQGLVCCALADVPVGIDVENVRPFSVSAARHVCTPEELQDICDSRGPDRQFFRYWTLKESCVKAMGKGLAYPLKQVRFRITEQRVQCLTQPEYRFILWENASQFIMALCYEKKGESFRMYENTRMGGCTDAEIS